jgi:Sulfatase/L,D-transpeptidase catalytic domain
MSLTRRIWLGLLASIAAISAASPPATAQQRPNIVIIWGDDIGQSNVSAYSHGVMGYKTPNIDRLAKEGIMFTDYYAEQSCTAGRASFITGQSGLRTGLTKVGLPGATLGLRKEDPTIAEMLKPLGYATGQFGKNHLGDRNEFLPTVHGFDDLPRGFLYFGRFPLVPSVALVVLVSRGGPPLDFIGAIIVLCHRVARGHVVLEALAEKFHIVWINLSAKGYGIHGTPEPSKVSKTVSHGCIRLTNWDAVDLAAMVQKGMSVAFLGGGADANVRQ